MNVMDWLFGVFASMALLFAIFGGIQGINIPSLPSIAHISGISIPQNYVDLNVVKQWNSDTNNYDYSYSVLAHFETNNPNRYLRIVYQQSDNTQTTALYYVPSAKEYAFSGSLADLPTYLQNGDVLVCAQAYENKGNTQNIITQDCVEINDSFGAGEGTGGGGGGAR